ncbi:MAG: T9SS type A sorting domain-containing protein [Candidatus Kapabacteria bacterium]|nr:T9SS type A sorting domain-containing protein [Candidatus Kapabacteria bacterium]
MRRVEFHPITFEMSPNPVQDKLIIKYKGYEDNEPITIMNIVGATLIETTINESMDVSNLSSGLYFLKIRNQVFKFVKE